MPSGAKMLEKASVEIFETISSNGDTVQMVRTAGTAGSHLIDTLSIPASLLEQRSGYIVSQGQLRYFAARAWDKSIAVVSQPLDLEVLNDIKKVVGLDIELCTPGGTSQKDALNFYIDRDYRDGGLNISIGGQDTTRFPLCGVISTEGPPAKRWVEKRFYFGMNTLPVTDLEDTGLISPVYVIVLRASLASLYHNIFSSANLVNRVILQVYLVLMVIFLIILIAIWATSIYVARNISSSAAKLMKGTQRLRQGDLEVQIPLSSRDELGEVANSFNLMTRDLKRMMDSMAEKERLEQELTIARSIQLNLLPQAIPELPGMDIFGMSEPAKEVGGDCYDFISINGDQMILSIGDVSGKGMAAALLMANLQASLRMLAGDTLTLVEIIRRLNKSICSYTTAGMFVTFFLGKWDNNQRRLTYVNAGHDYPMVARGVEFESLTTGGMVLGVDPEATYTEGSVELNPGDWLFLYSDGMVDARNAQGQPFEISMLQDLFRKQQHQSAKEIVTATMEEVRQFSSDRTYEDDRTLVALHVM
jgi:serine phosphatase RsbU (regulator of sigma subunit)